MPTPPCHRRRIFRTRPRWLAAGIVLAVLLAPTWWGGAAAEAPGPPAIDLAAALRAPGPLDFCGEPVPLEDPDVRERLEKELLLTLWDRPQVYLWLKRATRYLPLIEARLSQAGLPTDLQYMVLAESALLPHAGSPKGAIGFWQFMPETARRYGLRVDRQVDERRNLEASTRAAIAYLSELKALFGSWTLAAAAFNMGEQGLQAEVMAQEIADYYRLYLPLETQRYLFRVLAAKMVVSRPEAFGFHLAAEETYPPLEVEAATFTSPAETSLTVVAKAAGTDFKWIKDHNPELRGHYLEAGTHTLAVPRGAAEGFAQRFARGLETWQAQQQERIYVVQPGDNLSAIAARFEVPLPALLIWNRLDLSRPIHPGDRLIVHPTPAAD
jgi:hypothetical protein